MHLLAAVAGGGIDEGSPVDLRQTPAPLVLLSAADTDLAALAAAQDAALAADAAAPAVRLANLLQLKHPYAVDLYVETVVSRARVVVVRLLGGASYWRYGLEECAAACRRSGAVFIAIPGDPKPDADLAALTTAPAPLPAAVHALLGEGGPENAATALALIAALARGETPAPPAPRIAPKSSLYRPPNPADDRPKAAVLFYRALERSADLAGVDGLIDALDAAGLAALPIHVASLKDPAAAEALRAQISTTRPDVVLNATAFAVGRPDGQGGGSPLEAADAPILQTPFAGWRAADWADGVAGLAPRDVAMNVALPEVDGRLHAPAVAFKADHGRHPATQLPLTRLEAHPDRAAAAAAQAAAWARLRRTPRAARRVALVFANYPSREGRMANGVGLDAPAAMGRAIAAMAAAGYSVDDAPREGAALMAALKAGPTNALDKARDDARTGGETLGLDAYAIAFAGLPDVARRAVEAEWGAPEDDPFCVDGAFQLALRRWGGVTLGLQPSRGYDRDPARRYHDPALVPPHRYLAFHFWLRGAFDAHALVQMGKHGNLEWLPGKALALSAACWPELLRGAMPVLYPFIVNDPGEGAQAKRRIGAAVIDHLTPPLARAGAYGPLAELEALADEYAEAAALDPRRLPKLRDDLRDLCARTGLDADCGLAADEPDETTLAKIDARLCEIKETQIRDGLHVFGDSPAGAPRAALLAAIARAPRGDGAGPNAGLSRALAADLGLSGFDPLDLERAGDPWTGPEPLGPWRTTAQAIEAIEDLSERLVAGEAACDRAWTRTRAALDWIASDLAPRLDGSGAAEIAALIRGLDGRFLAPGPSGAPTRGRPEALPTGRNFFALDPRAAPTPAAWALGWSSAQALVERHARDQGDWPRAIALSAWGTANMRTGGDDIAQALALIGARPVWAQAGGRTTGYEILPIDILGRPRVDVTLRVSGFFRDAFPAQIDLLDQAIRAVGARDETAADNPIAARMAADRAALAAAGAADPDRAAGRRIFSTPPGTYGAGLQALIDASAWDDRADLVDGFLSWGGYAYGAAEDGAPDRAGLERRLGAVDAIVHNQDNREHDLLDSDDYYQFEGGLAAAAREFQGGRAPAVYHNDHSRPETPRIRTLSEEIGRTVRARAANPKWIAGVMRHGWKGAFEIAATVDYLFAFAATTDAVRDAHFDALYEAYLVDDAVRAFMAEANPDALRETAVRFQEALDRGLWRPRANDAHDRLKQIAARPP